MMEEQTENTEQIVAHRLTDESQETTLKGSSVPDVPACPASTQSTDAASSQVVEQVVENEQLDGSMVPIPQPLESAPAPPTAPAPIPTLAPDVYEGSPVASVQSGVSGELEETFGSPSLEGPLTPATDNSSTTKSLPGSGRVTPASQSDQSLYMSSSEKGTPIRKRRATDSAGRQIDFDNQSSSSGSVRNVRFPFRAGILWKKGERLEAMDFMHKWFPAKIREINEEELTVLIHFDGWNQRFDEWVDMASDRIRPLIRHSDRKEKSKRQMLKPVSDYKIGEQVYAKWTDCKMYPAKITGLHPNGSYEVIFYDGFKKQVQPINLRPMPGELKVETFEVSPVTASIPKKQKVRRESGTATSPTDGTYPPVSSPPIPKVKKEPRNRSKSTGKQRVRKNKVIPMEQFVTLPKDIAGFKADGTDPMEGTAAVLGIKSEPVSTQTEYAEAKMEIKQEPMSPDCLPIPTVVSEALQPDQPYIKPPVQEKAQLYGPPVLPPKAFVVEPDHNRYKCTVPGCGKGFRKEHLLEYHVKYYHVDGMGGPPPPQPQKRRRKTTSICSTESDSTPSSSRKAGLKKPRHSLAENFQVQIKQEVKEETLEEAALPLLTSIRPKQETGEISTQTMLLKQEAGAMGDNLPLPAAGADLESSSSLLHQRTMSQDSMLTEESSITDAEEFLKPDELVNCICDFYEENGLMIQCEVCLCWQHASCFGITERTLPKTYVCFVCENPPGVRESSRFIHEQDWLKCGELGAFNYLPNLNSGEERCASIKQTHGLVAEIHQLNSVLHSLKLQLKILRNKDESKLKLWRMDWDVTETFQDDDEILPPQINNNRTTDPANSTAETTNTTTKVTFTLSAGDDTVAQLEVVNAETVTTSSSERNQEPMDETDSLAPQRAEVKQGNGVPGETAGKEGLEVEKAGGTAVPINDVVDVSKTGEDATKAGEQKVEAPAMTASDSASKISNQVLSPGREGGDVEEGTHSDSTESVVEDPIEMYERNLLNQVQRVQADLADRMERIEEQLTVLESMEAVGTRRVPSATDDVTADMPQLKRSVRTLHGDLHKVKKMAVFH